jgi:transcription factor STE12
LGETVPSFGGSMLMQHHSHHPQRHMSLRSLPTSSYGTTGGNGSMDSYAAASLSAPSHKQSFDHPTMYAFEDASIAGDIGPARRHRSVTPSLVRSGGAGSGAAVGNGIRRPMTSSGGSDFGSPASVHSSLSSASAHSASGRGYHPYASASNSRAGSTTNSPQVHSTPLRSDSRASNYSSHGGVGGLHEQMRQLIMTSGNPGAGEEGMIMRTESPQMFAYQAESPAHFNVDLPPGMNVHPPHGLVPSNQAPMRAHSTTLPDTATGTMPHYEGFYPHQHATL